MKKILIVEDEVLYASLLSDALSADNDVIIARDGREGLRLAHTAKPDLILLDLHMPGADGVTMLEQLRDHEYGKDVAVIVLTNLEPTHRILQKMIEHRPLFYWLKIDYPFINLVEEINKVIA